MKSWMKFPYNERWKDWQTGRLESVHNARSTVRRIKAHFKRPGRRIHKTLSKNPFEIEYMQERTGKMRETREERMVLRYFPSAIAGQTVHQRVESWWASNVFQARIDQGAV